MAVDAVRGAVGFLTRLPVGQDDDAWDAFRRGPAAFPIAGYVIGALAAIPLVALAPPATAAAAFLGWVYLLTGVAHADGLTDLGDALAVHGDAARRREVMRDTTIGVGGALALAIVAIGLALAAFGLAEAGRGSDRAAVASIVVASEVGAKGAVATLVCLGEATHEGLGSALTEHAGPASLLPVAGAIVPTVAFAAVTPAAPVAALAALATGGAVLWLARSTVGGVSGDVFGATNELARLVALHSGVIAWTHL
ncbi:adenosylcobinamide-GDP ribazoletransferase [Halapricum desulfuricans]|uniref:Adenosylcobinamide-GDP ribazoletransferase n=1 Tax=Halapricum desulfuricans TaxID=2841257 RepID=A0A897N3L9_9EURY|nr:adenosylcobinamide-GDP ribazoletransferase [Halapricum desulfuricans]QSG06818.1 Cobalamin-5-phosphate synthase [Halapricum desulfuricans]